MPFGVTVRAFFALTAEKTTEDAAVAELARRALGFGKAGSRRIAVPVRGSAVILWQGTIESASDIVRVQIPIPREWLGAAKNPILKMCVCYDPPVNEAANVLWTCRKVNVTLHPGPEANGLKGRRDHATYPLFFREYKLGGYAPGSQRAAEDDLWVVELGYEEIFDYPPAMDFDPRQRVAFAAELIDRDSDPVDPQRSIQALPIATSMNRFSVQSAPVRTPVIVRTRGR
jgi:hypothetical protein